jgi:hypothetical protein
MDGGLISLLVAGVTAVGGIVGIVIQQGGATRDRVDALRKDLGVRIDGLQAELNALKRDLALLAQRVDAVSARVDELPAQPVDETECRDRHDDTNRRVADLQVEVRTVARQLQLPHRAPLPSEG